MNPRFMCVCSVVHDVGIDFFSMFTKGSTVRFSEEKGFGESYYILCPVCWNASIRLTRWEDGTREEDECATCRRMERMLTGNNAD